MAGVTNYELARMIGDAIREPLEEVAYHVGDQEFFRVKPAELAAAIGGAVADAMVLAAERGVETGEG